jgi:hypothetical protein
MSGLLYSTDVSFQNATTNDVLRLYLLQLVIFSVTIEPTSFPVSNEAVIAVDSAHYNDEQSLTRYLAPSNGKSHFWVRGLSHQSVAGNPGPQ